MDEELHTERNGRGHPRTIEAELLFQELSSGRDITILDVRSAEEYRGRAGRIAGARSLPIHQLAARACELSCHRSAPIVVVSGHGERSRLAAHQLEIAGYNEVRSLEGGMARWLALGYPIEEGTLRIQPPPSLRAPPPRP